MSACVCGSRPAYHSAGGRRCICNPAEPPKPPACSVCGGAEVVTINGAAYWCRCMPLIAGQATGYVAKPTCSVCGDKSRDDEPPCYACFEQPAPAAAFCLCGHVTVRHKVGLVGLGLCLDCGCPGFRTEPGQGGMHTHAKPAPTPEAAARPLDKLIGALGPEQPLPDVSPETIAALFNHDEDGGENYRDHIPDNPKHRREREAIAAAHPLKTGRHDLYETALRLVGERHEKGDLVELVTWLLLRIEEAGKR